MSWPHKKLELLASSERHSFIGGPFGSKLTSRDYVDHGVPVIRGTNLNNGRYLDMKNFVYVTDSKVHEDLSSNLAKPFDLVFTQRGTLGQVAIIPDDGVSDRYVVSQSQMKLTVDDAKANRLFLYYYFSSRQVIERITNFTSSSGVPHINLTVLRNFEVPAPPLETQERIASILSSYDDLIENNRRRIQLLEQAARLLYKEWFIHFRFPGHEHVIIKNGIPDEWQRRKIGECFRTVLGGTPSRKNLEYWGGDVPWINSGEVNKTRILAATEFITEHGLARSAAKVMPAGTCVLAITGATLGQVSRLEIECSANQSVIGIFDPEHLQNEWLYLFFVHEIKKIINHATGGAQQHINKEVVKETKFLQPPQALLNLFQEIITPLFSQIKNLELQNNSLISARDILLPRLMSGEVAV